MNLVSLFCIVQIPPSSADELKPVGFNNYQLVTGDDSEDDRRRWDKLYNTRGYVYGTDPSPFLKDHLSLIHSYLHRDRKTLDLAMGEGRNAVFLAQKGFKVDGIDISEVALRKAKQLAKENKVSLNTILADLNTYSIKPDSYNLILSIDYLQRSLIPNIKKGLKKGGIVVFENQTQDQLSNPDGRQIRRDFLLKKGELREAFKDFQILVYHEANDGKTAKASLIARKP